MSGAIRGSSSCSEDPVRGRTLTVRTTLGVISLRLVSMAQRHLAAHKFSVAAPVFAELAAAHPQAMLASRREGSVERDTSVTSSGTNYSLT
jgi:hypothetical protein